MSFITNINLLTFNGKTRTVLEEPICQKCFAKESEKPLHRCPRCLVVSFCEDCSTADSTEHRWYCQSIAENRTTMESLEAELRQEHNIVNIYQLFGPGRRIPRINHQVRQAPVMDATTQALWQYGHACRRLSSNLYQLALPTNSKQLLETSLDLSIKVLRMDCECPNCTGDLVIQTANILTRLSRFDHLFCFIRNYMAFTQEKVTNRPLTLTAWHECRGQAGACYRDCLGWIRSIYRDTYPTISHETLSRFAHVELLCILLMTKLRIRVPAARQAWEHTLLNVFFRTDMGEDLMPLYPVFREMFSFDDDQEQLEQIRGLMSIIHALDPSKLQTLMAVEGLEVIPGALDLLSVEFQSESFLDRWTNEPLIASFEADRWKRLGQRRIPLKVVMFLCCTVVFTFICDADWGDHYALKVVCCATFWLCLMVLMPAVHIWGIILDEWNQGKPGSHRCLYM